MGTRRPWAPTDRGRTLLRRRRFPRTFTTMLWHADIALYHAKQQRGSHRTYHPDMRMPRNAGRHGPRRRDQRPTGTHGEDTGEAAR